MVKITGKKQKIREKNKTLGHVKSKGTMKRKKGSEEKLPAYSVYPPDNAPIEDIYAYELIKLFAGAIQALNGGVLPMPTHWRDHLEDILKFHKVGKPPDPKVAAKHIETAKLDVLDKMARQRGDQESKDRTSFLEDLAEERGYHDANQIRRDTKPYKVEAFASILTDRLNEADKKEEEERIERAQNIQKRLENGESLDQILYDPKTSSEDFSAIRHHQMNGTPLEGYRKKRLSDFEKAEMWMNHGMNLHIQTPGYPRYFELDSETEAFINKAQKRKKTSIQKPAKKE